MPRGLGEKRNWTPAEVEELRALYGAGLSASQIGNKLGFTRSAVIGKANRLGLGRKNARELNLTNASLLSFVTRQREEKAKPKRKIAARRTVRPALIPKRVEFPSKPARPPVPLKGTEKPWLERAFGECAFPAIGEGSDVRSCCAPVDGSSRYCADHRALMFSKPEGSIIRQYRRHL